MAKNENWPPKLRTMELHHVKVCPECGGTGTSSVGVKGDTISMETKIEFIDCYNCNGEGYMDWIHHLKGYPG
jgi:DnaJ-class molecular chaperone